MSANIIVALDCPENDLRADGSNFNGRRSAESTQTRVAACVHVAGQKFILPPPSEI